MKSTFRLFENPRVASWMMPMLLLGLSWLSGAAGCVVEESAQEGRKPVGKKDLRLDDWIYEDHIRTVQFYRNEDEFSYPVLYMNDPQGYLQLEFDELLAPGQSASDLDVDIIHCDHNWEKSNLMPMEYVENFMYDRIVDWSFSQNTLIPYIHYWYRFPSEQSPTRILASGNYVLRVYRAGNERDLVLTRRFIVADQKVNIEPNIGLSFSVGERRRLQNIAFNLYPNRLQIIDPYSDLKIKILVNGRWDNHREGLRPQFINDNSYTYDFNSSIEFPGGNEYRKLDIRSVRFHSMQMKSVENRDSIYHITLHTDEPRTGSPYSTQFDFNGNYFIEVQEFQGADFSSDYVLVKFKLEPEEEITDGDVYVFGKLTDWRLKPENKLTYNRVNGTYEGELFLKQGFYDYAYVVKPKEGEEVDETRIEGSFNQTENYYTILVYYRAPGARGDELVGMKHLNYYHDQR